MDAFAVSICKGLSLGKITKKHMAIAGAWFGGFQALMPLIGYFLGSFFADMITKYAHWIAFALLIIIGGNMLKEAMGERLMPVWMQRRCSFWRLPLVLMHLLLV